MKTFIWEPAARADLRRLDRETAMRILLTLTRYGETGEGDVKKLADREGLHRLRVKSAASGLRKLRGAS